MAILLKHTNLRFVYVAGVWLCAVFYLLISAPSTPTEKVVNLAREVAAVDSAPACTDLHGANDTVVVMKTGSTEIRHKLPIHLATTIRCYPNYLIMSDIEERFEGEHIYDALEDVDSNLKEKHDDFELYRRLRQHGRESLRPSELSGPISRSQGGAGKPANPGWRVDKYKFLPMVRKAMEEFPDKKWYIFIETDTYIFWKTLLAYLAALDWTHPYYLGAQINIGDITFAQGGSSYVASRTALEMVVKHYIDHKTDWEEFTRNHWAGDCVLGKAFKDAGVPLTYAWPILQSDDIGEMNYNRTDNQHRLWCHPTVSYHHLSPAVIKDLWEFEQTWLSDDGKHTSSILRHKDVYSQYILPRVLRSRTDWDNHCDQDQGPVSSMAECRAFCETDGDCVQFSVSRDGRCFTTSRPNLGEASRGTDSGWIYDRMRDFYENADACGNEGWLS